MLMVKFVCPEEQEASSISNVLLAKGLVASTQIKEIDGQTYLVHSINCTLFVKKPEGK